MLEGLDVTSFLVGFLISTIIYVVCIVFNIRTETKEEKNKKESKQ